MWRTFQTIQRRLSKAPNFYFSSIKDKIRKERAERLKNEQIYFPIKSAEDLDKIRNIGIIAHIDAGKTTTTERMLFYAGALSEPGEVHDGNTVMDYMQQERDRGITIRAASITFSWNGYHFNLIDTPGHIDFTAEVERSLRVLDGVVAIFDGVSGVQTQSEMVWLQANKFNIPRLCFVNKMDRAGASIQHTVESIQNRLNVTPLVMQMPIGESESFKGLVDLINMQSFVWTDELGTTVDIEEIKQGSAFYDKASKQREKLIEAVALFDDKIAENYLSGKEIEATDLVSSIKNIINQNSNKVCALLLGSSLKNKGIQPLMDAIIDFLPPPSERPPIKNVYPNEPEAFRKLLKNEKLCAYVFKILLDKDKGLLAYTRIYSGVLSNRANLLNCSRKSIEKPQNIYRVRASKYVGLGEASAGDIVAIAGLKNTFSGDTLIDSKDPKFLMEELKMPNPVFMASLEYEYLKDKPALDAALKLISKEDSSLVIKDDEETGQIIISGLGELHIEILRDRLDIDFNLKTKIGKMRVAYRESIEEKAAFAHRVDSLKAGKPVFAHIELEIEKKEKILEDEEVEVKEEKFNENEIELCFQREPEFDIYYREYKKRLDGNRKKKRLESDWEDKDDVDALEANEQSGESSTLSGLKFIKNSAKPTEVDRVEDENGEDVRYSFASIPFDFLYSIEKTIRNSFSRGMLQGYPLIQLKVKILNGQYSVKRTSIPVLEMSTATLMTDILKAAKPIIMEPIMNMEISTPSILVREILNELLSIRRAKIGDIEEEGSRFGKSISDRSLVKALIPLSETLGYTTHLRSISKGEAAFVMRFKQYDFVGHLKQKELLENVI